MTIRLFMFSAYLWTGCPGTTTFFETRLRSRRGGQMQALNQPVLRESDGAFQRGMNGLLETHFKLSGTGGGTYDGEIQRSYTSPKLRLADITFTPHFTCLKAGKPNRRRTSYLVSHQIEGTSRVTQGGRDSEIHAGEIFFIDTTRPFEIETNHIRTRSIYLDTAFWRDTFPERDQYTATALGSDTTFGRSCGAMFDEIFEMPWMLDETAMLRIGESMAGLIAVAMISRPPLCGSEPDVSPIDLIRSAVRQNLSDPELSCARIAEEVGLSMRQVHAHFSATGTTLMRFAMAERLARVARDLENPALVDHPVSAIAFEWGFNEAAHFSRRFKARYGLPPAQYRARALSAPAKLPH